LIDEEVALGSLPAGASWAHQGCGHRQDRQNWGDRGQVPRAIV